MAVGEARGRVVVADQGGGEGTAATVPSVEAVRIHHTPSGWSVPDVVEEVKGVEQGGIQTIKV